MELFLMSFISYPDSSGNVTITAKRNTKANVRRIVTSLTERSISVIFALKLVFSRVLINTR